MIGDIRVMEIEAERALRERREARAERDPEYALFAEEQARPAGPDLSGLRRAVAALVLAVLGRT